jgi:hypothetical protein
MYVTFALLSAHIALAPNQTVVAHGANNQASMEAPPRLLQYLPFVDFANTQTPDHQEDYYIEVWTATWCGPCATYKAVEVPALVKKGYNVKVKDWDTDRPRPRGVTEVPTTFLFYKGVFIKKQGYWRAKDIDKFIQGRASLKKGCCNG